MCLLSSTRPSDPTGSVHRLPARRGWQTNHRRRNAGRKVCHSDFHMRCGRRSARAPYHWHDEGAPGFKSRVGGRRETSGSCSPLHRALGVGQNFVSGRVLCRALWGRGTTLPRVVRDSCPVGTTVRPTRDPSTHTCPLPVPPAGTVRDWTQLRCVRVTFDSPQTSGRRSNPSILSEGRSWSRTHRLVCAILGGSHYPWSASPRWQCNRTYEARSPHRGLLCCLCFVITGCPSRSAPSWSTPAECRCGPSRCARPVGPATVDRHAMWRVAMSQTIHCVSASSCIRRSVNATLAA